MVTRIWTPAFAGVTEIRAGDMPTFDVTPAKAGVHTSFHNRYARNRNRQCSP